ncbi:MAG: molecular chaperone HtpG [Clostridia bacterium]|nr:molecular chaperone HtpG [Clostridia bacterium]
MGTKQFKAESKRLLDLMINSIYTNKEIFLRELISNASDAIDKMHYRSLTDSKFSLKDSDLEILIEIDKENRNLIITDNGIGMTGSELENNLGTIAKSGSLAFKNENKDAKDVELIGQFGVGFYSAFMVSDMVTVDSKSPDEEIAHRWTSKGVEGYTVEPCEKVGYGTKITLHIKEDTEDEKYSRFLEDYTIEELVKKYSDYIRYPIRLNAKTLNSMVPIWKKNKSEIKAEDYDNFYMDKFSDYEKPIKVIHSAVEGQISYNALLFIPSHLPFDYYTKNYEKGLQLYSNGVLIMDKCPDLIPDYFSFVKGLVDSQDLSLNISREMLQHDRQLKAIEKNITNKIKSELEKMLQSNREEYEKFFSVFGTQLKYGAYSNFGMDKDKLKDLLIFYSSTEKKNVTLKEYFDRMKPDQNEIYYASGETLDKIENLPQVDSIKEKGYEMLFLTENIDEFVLQVLMEYEGKKFVNVCANSLDLSTDKEKEEIKKENEDNKSMLDFMKDAIGADIESVRFTNKLGKHPVCLTTEGALSIEMVKTLNNQMGSEKGLKAQTILEINNSHPIVSKLKNLYDTNKDELKDYTKILYSQARLIEGMSIDNPAEISNLICDLMTK